MRAPPPLEAPQNLLNVSGNIRRLLDHVDPCPGWAKTDVSNYSQLESRSLAERTQRREELMGQEGTFVDGSIRSGPL